MDDLIYVLVLIAWVAFAIFRQVNKRKAATSRPAGTAPGREPAIPTLEDVIFGEYSQPLETPSGSKGGGFDGRHPDSQEGFSLEEQYGSLEKGWQNERAPLSGPGPRIVFEDHFTEDEMEEEEEEAFDLRKAVIYAEILNRPYL
jgi:hypothetical protein